jgi:hypothetical protein
MHLLQLLLLMSGHFTAHLDTHPPHRGHWSQWLVPSGIFCSIMLLTSDPIHTTHLTGVLELMDALGLDVQRGTPAADVLTEEASRLLQLFRAFAGSALTAQGMARHVPCASSQCIRHQGST